ncbi:hypothetical protein CDEF62S_00248 [Castellaniella defragrans]
MQVAGDLQGLARGFRAHVIALIDGARHLVKLGLPDLGLMHHERQLRRDDALFQALAKPQRLIGRHEQGRRMVDSPDVEQAAQVMGKHGGAIPGPVPGRIEGSPPAGRPGL